MGKQHHARQLWIAFNCCKQIAEAVGLRGKTKLGKFLGKGPAHPVLMAAETRNEHEITCQFAQTFFHLIQPFRAARTMRMNSAARSGSTAFQVLPSRLSDEPTITPSAT